MNQNAGRIIVTFGEQGSGPLLIVLAGIHGNEPAGIEALLRVMGKLRQKNPPFQGFMVGLKGNLQALKARKRFLVRDLNRMWTEDRIKQLKTRDTDQLEAEEKELIQLVGTIEHYMEDSQEHYMLDLHTTSAKSGLFSIVTPHFNNYELASSLHVPVVFGLADTLDCTTNLFMINRCIRGLAFEAGQHLDPASIDLHEAAIWIMLEKIGCIDRRSTPQLDDFHERLIRAAQDLPHYVKVIYRHSVSREDDFHMYRGFCNFHQVYKGEPLGRDISGEVICPASGKILMPLYQQQGEDGFFIVKPIENPLC